MTGEHPDWLPTDPEGIADWMDQVRFDPDRELSPDEIPPVLAEGEDILVPRSFKIQQWVDEAIAEIAARRGPNVTKSDIVREMLAASVLSERAAGGEPDVLIPLADALRALAGLRHLPRSA